MWAAFKLSSSSTGYYEDSNKRYISIKQSNLLTYLRIIFFAGAFSFMLLLIVRFMLGFMLDYLGIKKCTENFFLSKYVAYKISYLL